MTPSQVRRIVAAVLIAIVGLTGTTALGFWQYSRAHRDDIAKQVLAAASTPVQELVRPRTYVPEDVFAHRATAIGRLLLDEALATCGRTQADGMNGCWIVAPIVVGGTSLADTVVLGFVPDGERASVLASVRARGAVQFVVHGRLQPGEVIDAGHALLKPVDVVANIDVNELALRWRMDLYDGFVVADPALAGTQVTTPLVLPPSGVTLRNLFYAWQWWTFAAFVLFLLYRYVQDVVREPRSIAEPTTEEQ